VPNSPRWHGKLKCAGAQCSIVDIRHRHQKPSILADTPPMIYVVPKRGARKCRVAGRLVSRPRHLQTGLMRKCGKGLMARLVRHRQPKGPVTDMPSLQSLRHISTLQPRKFNGPWHGRTCKIGRCFFGQAPSPKPRRETRVDRPTTIQFGNSKDTRCDCCPAQPCTCSRSLFVSPAYQFTARRAAR
jgi:hypothetical protein